MGTDVVEFGRGELVVVGGDYGRIEIEGTSPEARRTLDQIVGAARRCGDRLGIDSLIARIVDAPPVVANVDAVAPRNARGIEWEPGREPGALAGSEDAEGAVEGGARPRDDASDE